MKNAKHTPAPWRVIETNFHDGDHVADMSNGLMVVATANLGDPLADAHLIASAPCLLAVAKKIKAHGFLAALWLDELDAAINKATGGKA